MAPKKKAENTENTENIVEEVLVEQETMEAPKPKRKMTEAQKSNFNKLQAANKIRYEARRIAKEEVGEPIKDPTKNVNDEILEDKEAFIQKEITKKKTQVRKKKEPLLESEEEEAPMVVKKTAKKKKRRIVVEQDSSSSDEEIVISRRRRSKKPVVPPHPPSAPIPIPTNHNDNGTVSKALEEDTAPIEKDKPKKIEKVIPELKEYTHVQILKGLGL